MARDGNGKVEAIAEVAVEPATEGDRHGDLVARAVEALRGPGLDVEPGAASTTVMGKLDDVLHAVQRAHWIVADDAERVSTTVRLETRRGGIDPAERVASVARHAGTSTR